MVLPVHSFNKFINGEESEVLEAISSVFSYKDSKDGLVSLKTWKNDNTDQKKKEGAWKRHLLLVAQKSFLMLESLLVNFR